MEWFSSIQSAKLEQQTNKHLDKKAWINGAISFVFFVLIICFLRLQPNTHFLPLAGLYALLFVVFIVLHKRIKEPKQIFLIFLISALLCCIEPPYLSVDYFRFLWDGMLMHSKINPYDFTPNQFLQSSTNFSCQKLDLYAGLSDLSKSNYSCYPLINQWYFYLSTFQNLTIEQQLFIMRILIILTESIGFIFAIRLLQNLKLPSYFSSVLFLNPLFLIETLGNVHFEGVMISFVFVFLYFLEKSKILFSSLCLGAAIQIKLIPLIFIPFLLRYLGWKSTVLLCLLAFLLIFGLQFILIDLENYSNFLGSIQLYLNNFEFNSILLYPYLQYGWWQYGWNMTRIYSPKLAQYFFWLSLSIAFYGGTIDFKTLLNRLVLASSLYLIFTSTVHPWYWILPLSLSVFIPDKNILYMSGLTFLSYGLYYFETDGLYRQLLMGINLVWALVYLKVYLIRLKNYLLSFFALSGTGS